MLVPQRAPASYGSGKAYCAKYVGNRTDERMDNSLPQLLTSDERSALQSISRDADAKMPAGVRERLQALGLADDFHGGLLITDEGLLEIADDAH
jgi:hypothetical protein